MTEPSELEELVAHLSRTSRLTPPEAAKVVDEVLGFLSELPEQFVRRRHRSLQQEGRSNDEIFARLAAEVARWRFRAPVYSERQLRRVIYG